MDKIGDTQGFKHIVHTKTFMDQWKLMLMSVYGYSAYMDYLIVPSLFYGKKTLSYVHFLDFSDRLSGDVDDLLELSKDNDYHIRTLNPYYADFKKNDTVNMRLDTSSGDVDDILVTKLHQNCRRKVRQSIKRNNFEVIAGDSTELIDEFYIIFAQVMHRHGTPLNTKLFFVEMMKRIDSKILIYKLNGNVIAGSILVFDGKIANLFWSVIDDNFKHTQIGYFTFWNAIKYAVEIKNSKVFDFGRSSYGGFTYKFKLQWGAEPIKVDIFRSDSDDVYSKYSLASYVWKKLPKSLVDYLGPRISKYLIDL